MKLRRVVAPIGLALGLLLSACTPSVPKLPDATPVAQALASALVSGDFGGVTFTWPADAVTKEYGVVVAGMDGVRPASVQVGDITYQTTPQAATVELNQTYDFGEQWNFLSVANLQLVDGNWQVIWQPSIIQPALDGNTRLSITVTPATRGEILADDGSAIVWNRPVYNVGIDKTRVSADQAVTSARQLAQVVGIDPDAYAQKVSSSGPKAFVIAITLREGQVPTAVAGIPGTLTQAATMSLGPDKTFAIGLLGTAGDVTAEDIQNSGGKLQAGEVVGKSGLQASQDAALRGTDGVTVYIAPRAAGDVMAAPSSVRPTATPITSKQPLFQVKPQNGASLSTTLDVALQTKAEAILAGQSEIASMVVLNSQTGALLVAANSPAAGANSYATTGRYPPGSTFKVSTALALMRTGMTPDSTIDCPTSVTVSGRQFSNLDGYATSHNGTITLRQAVAWSCNTAMVNGSKTLQAGDLGAAAASLGIGIDHNVGFPAYFGSVPLPAADVDKAADAFGQGDVLASPLAMATEAASVAAGRTIVPYLLVDPTTGQPWQPPAAQASEAPNTPGSSDSAPYSSDSPSDSSTSATAAPLTDSEVAGLRDVMNAVVTIGSGTSLKGLVDGAKTGTAEFTGDDGQIATHAWMIAYNSQYAIAVFVNNGSSGSGTAGPLIKSFLT